MSFLITVIDENGMSKPPYHAIGDAQALQDDAYDNKDAFGLVMLVLS